MTSSDLAALLVRAEAAEGADRELLEQIALALGWQPRKVTRLGLNGRTPGRLLWVTPDPPWEPRTLPAFLGVRKRAETIAMLRALLALAGDTPGGGGEIDVSTALGEAE